MKTAANDKPVNKVIIANCGELKKEKEEKKVEEKTEQRVETAKKEE